MISAFYYIFPNAYTNSELDTAEVLQFTWPLDCNMRNVTVDDCKNDEILNDIDFWVNLDRFSNCSSTFNSSMTLDDVPDFKCK